MSDTAMHPELPFDAPEQWRDIPDYEGLYEISDLGRIRSARRQGARGGIKKLALTPDARWSVSLCKDGQEHTYLVHRLVLRAFVGPCPPGEETRHGPGGSMDNRLTNLCWGTALDNCGPDKLRDGTLLRGERCPTSKLTEADIAEIRKRYAAGEIAREIACDYGINAGHITKIIRGETWAHIPGAEAPPAEPWRPRGELHGRAKLTESQVAEIKRRWAAGETQTALGREFGVTQSAVSLITRGINWRRPTRRAS